MGEGYETVNQYYGSYIEKIEEPHDIKEFAENLAEELRQDYGGELSEDERSKFHYALMYNSMTIAYKRMLKEQVKERDSGNNMVHDSPKYIISRFNELRKLFYEGERRKISPSDEDKNRSDEEKVKDIWKTVYRLEEEKPFREWVALTDEEKVGYELDETKGLVSNVHYDRRVK